MNRGYQVYVINSLYGLMEGNASSLERSFKKNFERKFNTQPESFTVTQTDLLVDSVWAGSMEATLVMDGETFVCNRDWLEEYNLDKQHPNYDDEYFYEGVYNYAYKKSRELISKLDEQEIDTNYEDYKKQVTDFLNWCQEEGDKGSKLSIGTDMNTYSTPNKDKEV